MGSQARPISELLEYDWVGQPQEPVTHPSDARQGSTLLADARFADAGGGTAANRNLQKPPLQSERKPADSREPADKRYEVTVRTTNINNAGTKCDVYVNFIGENRRESGPLRLKISTPKSTPTSKAAPTILSRGQTITFDPVDVPSIGDVEAIQIGIAVDLKGPSASDAWNCFSVIIKANNLEKKFDCCQWIGPRDQTREANLDLRSSIDDVADQATVPAADGGRPAHPVTPAQSDRSPLRASSSFRTSAVGPQRASLRASAAGSLHALAAGSGGGRRWQTGDEEPVILYRDHDGFKEIETPQLTWYYRELLPVKRIKPETVNERLRQSMAAPKEFDDIPDEQEKIIGVPEESQRKILERPPHRQPKRPPYNNIWLPVTTHITAEQAALQEMKEREAFTEWLRGDDIDKAGVVALAKRLNKSRSYVEQKLRHFETTNRKHHYYVPPSPASTIRTRPPTARAENQVHPIGGLLPDAAGVAGYMLHRSRGVSALGTKELSMRRSSNHPQQQVMNY